MILNSFSSIILCLSLTLFCMLEINNNGKKITIAKLAKLLNCASRTIHRNMCVDLKREKELLNKQNEKI